jgi:hypothetical protein
MIPSERSGFKQNPERDEEAPAVAGSQQKVEMRGWGRAFDVWSGRAANRTARVGLPIRNRRSVADRHRDRALIERGDAIWLARPCSANVTKRKISDVARDTLTKISLFSVESLLLKDDYPYFGLVRDRTADLMEQLAPRRQC